MSRKIKTRSLETFLENLRKIAHNYRWYRTEHNMIRAEPLNHKNDRSSDNSPKRDYFCPLTAVARSHRLCNESVGNYDIACEKLRMAPSDGRCVMWAADDRYDMGDEFHAGVRCRLNEAVGL